MTFKNKKGVANSLKIACLKKDFRLKKVINSRNVFSFKCSYPDCNWWLRVVNLQVVTGFALESMKSTIRVVQSILQAIIPTPR